MRVIEAAAELGVTDSRVRQLIRLGALKARPFGPRFYLVERASVEAYKEVRRPPGRPRRNVLRRRDGRAQARLSGSDHAGNHSP